MTLTNYWWLLIWIFVGGVILNYFPQNDVLVGNHLEKRWSYFSAIILILPFILWATYRSSGWGDTGAYRTLFYSVPSDLKELPDYVGAAAKDKGFTVVTILLKHIWSKTSVFYFFVIALIQLFCLMYIYRKYSCDYWLSIFVFIATTDYMSWCHNGVRQFLAVCIIFAMTEFILRRKYIPVIVVILLVSTIHGSALLMLPIVFLLQGKAWNKKSVLCILAAVIALMFVDQFTNVLEVLLSDTRYTNVVTDWKTGNDNGTNPIRVLVYAVPTILSIVGYKYIRKENNPIINLSVNASIISTALAIISIGTSGIFIGRLPIYCSLYANGILLPWEINNIFTQKSAILIKGIAVICYVLFFYYQMHYIWGIL